MKRHFFGKDCPIDNSLNNPEEFQQKLKILGFDFKCRSLFVNQVHGDKVVIVDDITKIYDQEPLPKADAIVTNVKNLPIAVVTADCVPIVFCDDQSKVVAIVHAGWKGAIRGVIENTVNAMISLGANVNNIIAEIGPCIRQPSYEVSKEFFDNFIVDDSRNKEFFTDAKKKGHFMFDLPKYCIAKLKKLEVGKVIDFKIDTYENEEAFCSYRRSTHKKEEDCGRNISTIMLT